MPPIRSAATNSTGNTRTQISLRRTRKTIPRPNRANSARNHPVLPSMSDTTRTLSQRNHEDESEDDMLHGIGYQCQRTRESGVKADSPKGKHLNPSIEE